MGIHGNHDLLFLSHESVPILHLFLDPRFELLSQHSGANIYHPLFGNLRQVDLIREVLADPWLGTHKVHDLLESEILVLGNMKSFHIIDMNVGLSPRQDIFEEVDRRVILKNNGRRIRDRDHEGPESVLPT